MRRIAAVYHSCRVQLKQVEKYNFSAAHIKITYLGYGHRIGFVAFCLQCRFTVNLQQTPQERNPVFNGSYHWLSIEFHVSMSRMSLIFGNGLVLESMSPWAIRISADSYK